jgi:hypothetical protein
MTRSDLATAFGVAVVLAFAANAGSAAPFSHGAQAILESNETSNLVEQVHGTHRACVRGWVHRWGVVRRHRHVGVAHVPVRC